MKRTLAKTRITLLLKKTKIKINVIQYIIINILHTEIHIYPYSYYLSISRLHGITVMNTIKTIQLYIVGCEGTLY